MLGGRMYCIYVFVSEIIFLDTLIKGSKHLFLFLNPFMHIHRKCVYIYILVCCNQNFSEKENRFKNRKKYKKERKPTRRIEKKITGDERSTCVIAFWCDFKNIIEIYWCIWRCLNLSYVCQINTCMCDVNARI